MTNHRAHLTTAIARGMLGGLVGGFAFGAAMIDLGLLETIAQLVRSESTVIGFIIHLLIAVVIGGGFGALVFFHRPDVGETVFWGLTYGALWWFIGAMTLLPLLSGQDLAWRVEDAQPLLPALIGHLLYGGIAGLVVALGPGQTRSAEPLIGVYATAPGPTVGTALRGGLVGLLGGVLLGLALEDGLGLPAVSGAMADTSRPTAWMVTVALGVLAGIGFALLFPEHNRGTGPMLIRGLAFGFLTWLVVALTLIPLALGNGLQWDVDAVRVGFGTLPGYLLLLGALPAFGYALLTKMWRGLTTDNLATRVGEGIGTQGLRAISGGLIAGSIGGLVFTIIMIQIGFLSTVAELVGLTSPVAGFIVHLLIANLIGIGYGILFVGRSNDPGSALGWGVAYGTFWWMLGPLTLLPVLLGDGPTWSAEAARDAYPALVGHLGYGAFLGLAFHRLERRLNPWWVARNEAEAARAARATTQLLSSAPALWLLTVLLAVAVPLLVV